MKNTIKTTLFVTSTLVVGFGIYQMTRASAPSTGVEVTEREHDVLNPADRPVVSNPEGTPSGQAMAVNEESSLAPKQFEWFPSAQEAVMEFTQISEKIFPSPDEAMRKSEILMNADFLRNVTDYLLTGHNAELKDQAVDMIIAAMKMGSPEATVQAERIISDQQIEDSRLPASVRQNLAETKGEILSEFAAMSPDQEARVPALLPGKVSQRIWSNVQEFHEQNFQESQKELGEAK